MTTVPIVALLDGEVLDPQWILDITNTANDHETRIDAVDAKVATVSIANSDATSRTTASTSYTSTLSPANICGVSFTAPPSGKVVIGVNCQLSNSSGPNVAQCAPVIKTGSTVGSGTGVLSADDGRAVTSIANGRGGITTFVAGLTSGTVYNVSLEHRAFSAGTATFSNREVVVTPQLA